MKYCDIHTHILPKMDDGSQSLAESIKLITNLKRYGVDTIALTPHYYSDKEPIDKFLHRRNEIYNKVKDKLPDGVKYVLGAEVFVTDVLFGADDISSLCYEGTRFLLTEFGYDITPERAVGRVEMLCSKYGVVPIIAHIERYPKVFKKSCVQNLIRSGAYIQINIDCIQGILQKRKIMELARNGLIHYIGTDTHSFKRCPDFASNAQKIIKCCGRDFFVECATLFNNRSS